MLTMLWLALLPTAVAVEVLSLLALSHYRVRPRAARNATPASRERDGASAYRLPVRPSGLRPGAELMHALRLADSLEDEGAARKLQFPGSRPVLP